MGLIFSGADSEKIYPWHWDSRNSFFTKGIGRHKTKFQSYGLALRDAKIEKYNLVQVSSIFPPNCKIVSVDEGVGRLDPGQIVFCVLAKLSTNEPERMLGAAIGLAIPTEGNHYGYLSEHLRKKQGFSEVIQKIFPSARKLRTIPNWLNSGEAFDYLEIDLTDQWEYFSKLFNKRFNEEPNPPTEKPD